LDEDRILARLRALRSDLVDSTIAVHHRRIVKRTGDGSLIEFRSGVDAVRCPIERASSIATSSRPTRRPAARTQSRRGRINSAAQREGLGATKGVFVTTSTFSPQARDFVRHLSQRVILLDGQNLADLMIEHGVGVRTSRAIEFKRLGEDFFSEDD
jgi:hypothetical protein